VNFSLQLLGREPKLIFTELMSGMPCPPYISELSIGRSNLLLSPRLSGDWYTAETGQQLHWSSSDLGLISRCFLRIPVCFFRYYLMSMGLSSPLQNGNYSTTYAPVLEVHLSWQTICSSEQKHPLPESEHLPMALNVVIIQIINKNKSQIKAGTMSYNFTITSFL